MWSCSKLKSREKWVSCYNKVREYHSTWHVDNSHHFGRIERFWCEMLSSYQTLFLNSRGKITGVCFPRALKKICQKDITSCMKLKSLFTENVALCNSASMMSNVGRETNYKIKKKKKVRGGVSQLNCFSWQVKDDDIQGEENTRWLLPR